MRLFTCLLVVFFTIFIFTLQQPITDMKQYSEGLITFLGLYDIPYTLGSYYYTDALIPYHASVIQPYLEKKTQNFMTLKNNKLANYYIFNDIINKPKEYLPFRAT